MTGKLFFGILILLVAGTAYGQQWVPANQVTVTWDVVTTYGDNTTLPQNALVNYVLYATDIIADPDKERALKVGEASVNQCVVTLTHPGKYLLGIKAVEMHEDMIVGESEIVWSDNPDYCRDGHTFGVLYYSTLSSPKEMSLEGNEPPTINEVK